MNIDSDLWQDFIGHRQDLKKPLTERAERRLLKKIERALEQGWTAEAVEHQIERSIINGWQDVYFEIKDKPEPVRQRETNPYVTPSYGMKSTKEVASAAIVQMRAKAQGE